MSAVEKFIETVSKKVQAVPQVQQMPTVPPVPPVSASQASQVLSELPVPASQASQASQVLSELPVQESQTQIVYAEKPTKPFMSIFIHEYLKYFITYSIIACIVVVIAKFIYYYYLIEEGELPKDDEQSIYVKCIKNPKGCASAMIMKLKEIFMQPILEVFNVVFSLLHRLVWDIQHIRQFIANLRKQLQIIYTDVYNKLLNIYKRIIKIYKVIVKTVHKLMELLTNIFEVLNYTFHTLGSMWNGPIGAVTRSFDWLFCFGKGTKLTLVSGEEIEIEKLKLGMKLRNGGEVISLMKFIGNGVEMYKYNNTIVSGEHTVFEDNEWKRIEDAKYAIRTEYNEKYIYCLETEEHYIKINKTIYGDYIEISDKVVNNNIQDIVIDYMNNKTFKKYNKNSNTLSYNWCFYERTLIDMDNGKYKRICDLKIGDNIKTGIVRGLVKTNAKNIEIYKYNNIILSGTSLVKIKYDWIQICDIKEAQYIGKNDIIMYNIVTDTNMISIRDEIFCDFDQTSDPIVNNYIDDLVIQFLNSNENIQRIKYLHR